MSYLILEAKTTQENSGGMALTVFLKGTLHKFIRLTSQMDSAALCAAYRRL